MYPFPTFYIQNILKLKVNFENFVKFEYFFAIFLRWKTYYLPQIMSAPWLERYLTAWRLEKWDCHQEHSAYKWHDAKNCQNFDWLHLSHFENCLLTNLETLILFALNSDILYVIDCRTQQPFTQTLSLKVVWESLWVIYLEWRT